MQHGPRTDVSRSASRSLRPELEDLGRELTLTLTELLAGLPDCPPGPRRLAEVLHESVPTASRLLKAIRQEDPLAMLVHLPGPDPLRRILNAAARRGADPERVKPAREAVQRLETFIRDVVGDRGRLHTLLQGWIPEERQAFETRRRQAAFKAISELRGVVCDLDLASFLLAPSPDGEAVDLVCLLGRIGLSRLREDSTPRLATRSLRPEGDERAPTNLRGDVLTSEGPYAHLDEFTTLPTASIRTLRVRETLHYLLDPDWSSGEDKVDLVLAEVNRKALPLRSAHETSQRYLFHVAEMSTKATVLDLYLHESLCPGAAPTCMLHDIAGEGPGNPHDPAREPSSLGAGKVRDLGMGMPRVLLPDYERYEALVGRVFASMRWDIGRFRGYRFRQEYPLPATQISMIVPNGDRGAV